MRKLSRVAVLVMLGAASAVRSHDFRGMGEFKKAVAAIESGQ